MELVCSETNNDNNNNSSKVCGVCGDKALGYNFCAVTCESCKAFFRRNALSNKDYRCPFNEQCEITAVTRRFCQKCRLEKCFAIGMRKDYIMTEQDKVEKRKKIEQNRARRRSQSTKSDNSLTSVKPARKRIKHEYSSEESVEIYYDSMTSPDSPPSAGSMIPQTSPESYHTNDNYLNSNNNDNHGLCDTVLSDTTSATDTSVIRTILNPTPTSSSDEGSPFNNNHNSPSDHTTDIPNVMDFFSGEMCHFQDMQRVKVDPNSIESILCEAIKLEYEAFSSLSQGHNNSRELNDAERAKLNELIVANKALLAPLDDDINSISDSCDLKPNKERTDARLLDVINLTAIAIRRLIKMAKKISAFKNMCQEDQVALLKGGCTEMMILRSTSSYDPNKRTWKIPHSKESMSNIRTDVLKLAKGNIYQEHERFMKTFDSKWSNDENIVLILCAIALFTPDRPRVIHKDVIKLEQNSYYYLLRRYLESIYPGCEAKSIFLKLIQKIAELHRLNDEVINVYLDVNPSHVEPLLIEIFDLKHQ